MATIASVVSADVGAVKVRLHRARRKLRECPHTHAAGGRHGSEREAG